MSEEREPYGDTEPLDPDTITLTTARAESSYGVPVLVINGVAYGPHDWTPYGTTAAALVREWAERFCGATKTYDAAVGTGAYFTPENIRRIIGNPPYGTPPENEVSE